MGFFSAIGGALGSLLGPIGTVIGAGIGGALDGKKTEKVLEKQVAENNRIATIAAENTNAQMENNSRPVETVTTSKADFDSVIRDAEKAGINPLTALRTAGANVTTTTNSTQVGLTKYVAPLLSSMPSRNFLDVMSDAFTGYKSFERGRTQKLQLGLETDLLKSQIAMNLAQTDGYPMERINLGAKFYDPMTNTEFVGLNPEAFEMGVSELAGSASMHAAFAGTQVFGTKTASTANQFSNKLDNIGANLDQKLQDFKAKYFKEPKFKPISKSYIHNSKVNESWVKEAGALFD